jgi:hypothetical protein
LDTIKECIRKNKIIFCNVVWMKEYRGRKNEKVDFSKSGGGSWIKKHAEKEGASEEEMYVDIEGYHYGCVFLGRYYKNGQELLKKIRLEDHFKECTLKDDNVENITVVWVAEKDQIKKTGHKIVGVWSNATVYRKIKEERFAFYNIKAESKNCILIEEDKREFSVYRAKPAKDIVGMGQSNIWYAEKEPEQDFAEKVKEYVLGCYDK